MSALGRVFVQIWDIMHIIQQFFPNYDYISMTPSPGSKPKHLDDTIPPPFVLLQYIHGCSLIPTFKLEVTFVFSDFVLVGTREWPQLNIFDRFLCSLVNRLSALAAKIFWWKYKKSAIVRRGGGALRDTLNCAILLCALRFLYKSTTTAHTTYYVLL